MYVSKDALERALSFGNRLFGAFEQRGYRACFAPANRPLRREELDERTETRSARHYWRNGWGPDRVTAVFIGTVAIGLTIFELSELVEAKYSDGVYIRVDPQIRKATARYGSMSSWTSTHDMPSGRLGVRMYSPYWSAAWEQFWREEKRGELESKIGEMVAAAEEQATPIAARVAEAKRKAEEERVRWDAEQEQRRREEQERRRLERLKASREQLVGVIGAWEKARWAEAFFEDVLGRAASLPEEARREVEERVARARQILGGVDALKRFEEWTSPEQREGAGKIAA